ncbi:MAG: DNA polymerase III subunit gamma/tau [Opitutaceae bacterium]|nr:DNA polymerase III subunit gamma/tau [Opitutaceae bacterium]
MTERVAWPPPLVGTPAVAVIENAIARQRLSHSVLLHGDDLTMLVQIAQAIADRLLNTPESSAHFTPDSHPDCFDLRPTGKMRQITAENTRELIGKVQVSTHIAPRKVAIIHECDRMNLAAANIFLKTLEEPPAHTTLLLLTTRPYALLPTIRSRVLLFRFPSVGTTTEHVGFPAWLTDYQAWLGRLAAGVTNKRDVADHVFTLYGLVARFDAILEAATSEAWKTEKDKLPADLDDDEQVAIETGLANGIRQALFAGIEHATRAYAVPRLRTSDAAAQSAHTAAITALEHNVGLLRLNLNVATALENFLLSSLRLWAKR